MSSVREQQAVTIIKQKLPQLKVLAGDDRKASVYASTLKQLALNKNLSNVDVESVLGTAFEIVQAGLNPNPLFGQAYVVPYKGKAQLQIGYKGWISVGYRNGWKFRAVAVYDVDHFKIKFNGLNDEIEFEPNYDERSEEDGAWVYKHLKGVIVYAADKDGNVFSEFVPFKKLEKLRCQNPFQKPGELPEYFISKKGEKVENIWFKWAEEMYKAKALKYVITRLPITEQIMELAVKEDEVFREESNGEATVKQQPTTTQTIDPLSLTKPKEQEIQTAKVMPETEKITPKSFAELYKSLNKEQSVRYLEYMQGVNLAELSEEELANFYKEVKEYVGA